jgi:hypothetical protein
MSRSGYTEDCEDVLAIGRYKAILRSTMRGKKGQAFLKELLAALDSMPEKRLIREHIVIDGQQDSFTGYYGPSYPQLIVGADELVAKDGTVAAMGDVCALGALGKARGMKGLEDLDPEEPEDVAAAFGTNDYIIREIVYHNDEMFASEWVPGKKTDSGWVDGYSRPITPEERWQKMRDWIASKIIIEAPARTEAVTNEGRE